ncbi:hypothetical protein CERZMDRAFT_95042 [Cercospora zeae-maydis SCOH1-5]|uniref:Rhodopsin domain-containing protein n=1 Tax=Cercospora zeae-maydis SCOH1-5 TaxID=717836 RepID=A0A6A6FMR3_9PEZI|nr:hypothetical protein CERZMDRAFT_95042 [Cercospora zeae-maydis SCOH1-5]
MGNAAFLYGDRGITFLAITWAWTSIAAVLYVLRAASVARQKSDSAFCGIRWDFVWVTVALVLAFNAQIIYTISYNFAAHGNQGLTTVAQVILFGTIASLSALTSSVFGRCAVVALLLQLQGPTYPKGRIALWFVAVSQFVINAIQLSLTINQCDPPSRLWNIMEPGTCPRIIATRKLGFFTGAYGAFCDLALAFYPVVLIIGPLLQINPKVKAAICIVMAGGAIAGVAGIVKTVQLANLLYVQYDYATIVIWILTETWFIIIFGSITTTRPIFVAIGRHIKLFGTGFWTSTKRLSNKNKIDSVEMSSPCVHTEHESKIATSRIKDQHDLSDDELALRDSYAHHPTYDRSPV